MSMKTSKSEARPEVFHGERDDLSGGQNINFDLVLHGFVSVGLVVQTTAAHTLTNSIQPISQESSGFYGMSS